LVFTALPSQSSLLHILCIVHRISSKYEKAKKNKFIFTYPRVLLIWWQSINANLRNTIFLWNRWTVLKSIPKSQLCVIWTCNLTSQSSLQKSSKLVQEPVSDVFVGVGFYEKIGLGRIHLFHGVVSWVQEYVVYVMMFQLLLSNSTFCVWWCTKNNVNYLSKFWYFRSCKFSGYKIVHTYLGNLSLGKICM
jgi:hypothetical protein